MFFEPQIYFFNLSLCTQEVLCAIGVPCKLEEQTCNERDIVQLNHVVQEHLVVLDLLVVRLFRGIQRLLRHEDLVGLALRVFHLFRCHLDRDRLFLLHGQEVQGDPKSFFFR